MNVNSFDSGDIIDKNPAGFYVNHPYNGLDDNIVAGSSYYGYMLDYRTSDIMRHN